MITSGAFFLKKKESYLYSLIEVGFRLMLYSLWFGKDVVLTRFESNIKNINHE
jgi:hypothetical protein